MRGESSGRGSGSVGSDELRTGAACMRRERREKSHVRRKGHWSVGRSMIGKLWLWLLNGTIKERKEKGKW